MVDTQLPSVRVMTEDTGTGAPFDAGDGDHTSAGDLGALALQSGDGNYVEDGFDLTLANATTVDISAGLLFARLDGGVIVQDSRTGTYSISFDAPMTFGCYSPGINGISLDADAVNELWVSVDRTSGDTAFVRHGSNVTAPSDPAVKIGEIDTTDGTVSPLNRGPSETFDSLQVLGAPTAQRDAVRKADLDAHVGGTNPHSVTLEQARQTGAFQGSVDAPSLSVSGSPVLTESDPGPAGPRPTPEPTTDYTASWNEIILADASSSGFSVTLPSPDPGRVLDIVKAEATQNTLSITPPGSQSINDQSVLELETPYRSRTITSSDTDYYIL